MKPLALITVTYSPGAHLQALLDSIPAATARRAHVVMADNGSTDGSVERAESDYGGAPGSAQLTTYLHRTGGNVGYGTAINSAVRALRVARERGEIDPDYFVIVNPDVEFTAGSIDELDRIARENPQAGAIGPLIENTDGTVYPSARELPSLVNGAGHALLSWIWPSNPFTVRYHRKDREQVQREAGWLSGSCLYMRWDAFDSIGGFDEAYFMYMEDVDLGDRLSRAGWANVYAPSSRIIHDQGHSAKKHASAMLPAHHESAYRYQADRHRGLLWAPLRASLWIGLKFRASIMVKLSQLVG